MDQARTEGIVESPWGGGVSPFAVGWSKLMMWVFIITDGLLFAGFLGGYGIARLASAAWPDRSAVFHLNFIALMTFTLISSSATMATAVAAARKGDKKIALRFLLLTIAGGLAFLGMQAYEWTTLIRAGARLDSNPWGVPHLIASKVRHVPPVGSPTRPMNPFTFDFLAPEASPAANTYSYEFTFEPARYGIGPAQDLLVERRTYDLSGMLVSTESLGTHQGTTTFQGSIEEFHFQSYTFSP